MRQCTVSIQGEGRRMARKDSRRPEPVRRHGHPGLEQIVVVVIIGANGNRGR